MAIIFKGGFKPLKGKFKFRSVSSEHMSAIIEIVEEVSSYELNSGETIFTFNVTRSGDMTNPVTLQYAVSGFGDNPATPSDFYNNEYPSGNLYFAPGQSITSIMIGVKGDEVVEPDEKFKVSLTTENQNVNFIRNESIGIIINDDVLNELKFETPSGLLGTFNMEEEFYVKLEVSGGNPDNYIFSLHEGTLPHGVVLNSISGELTGELPYVEEDTISTFIVKVTDGEYETYSEFSIKIKNTEPKIVWLTPEGTLVDAPGGYPFLRKLEANVEK